MVYIGPKHLELEDRVIAINHVTKVVKSGRRLRFVTLVIVGDKNGYAGFGTGRAQEVPEAIRRAIKDARRNLVEVPMVGSIIPYEVIDVFDNGRTLMRPAIEGFEVAAGGPVHAVLGLTDVAGITSKPLGSNAPINVVFATVEGLKQLKRTKEMAALRGESIKEIVG